MLSGFSCETRQKEAGLKETRRAAACHNPDISQNIVQRDTAGLSESRAADAYLNNSFIYFC